MIKNKNYPKPNKDRSLLKGVGSVLFAIFASSHHWLHTLLIALGLTTFGTSLFAMPPSIRLVFLIVSLAFSIWFILIAKKKWTPNRPAAWVYLVSSIISIILVITAIPDTISSLSQINNPIQEQQIQDQTPQQEQDHTSHHL